MSWQIDPAHSHIQFSVRHMMIAKVRGRFDAFNGAVHFDENNPANTSVDIEIAGDSINTRNNDRDAHLRSADFFNVETYPNLYFVSQRVEQEDEHNGRLIGDLTIKNITREVALDVEYLGTARSPWGSTNAGFAAKTSIDRKDWELTWNVALETGGWLVGDKIDIEIELELVKQVETEAELTAAD